MQYKKTLLEAKETSPEVLEFITRMSKVDHPFINAWDKNFALALKEGEIEIGALRGKTVGDAVAVGGGMQVYATLEIFNAVIRGFTRYMDDSFVRKYTTNSVIFKVPKTEYQENVGDISGGQFGHTEKMIDYATVDLSTPESERGGKVTWTRALLEDVTFDVQAEMAEGLGHAIAVKILSDILEELMDLVDSTTTAVAMPHGSKITISDPITWEEFLSVIGAVDIGFKETAVTLANSQLTLPIPADIGKPVVDSDNGDAPLGILLRYDNSTATAPILYISQQNTFTADHKISVSGGTGAGEVASSTKLDGVKTYGPADFALVSPDVYWALLNIIQMTNVLYEGSTDPVNKGVIKLALGTTILKQSLLPSGTIIALNSEKAIALVTRRQLKIEPVLFPVWNEYGFIGTVRYGVTTIFPGAIQIGQTA